MASMTERLDVRLTPVQDNVSGAAQAQGAAPRRRCSRDGPRRPPMFVVVDDDSWNELHEILSRPLVRKPHLAKLLTTPSVLERP